MNNDAKFIPGLIVKAPNDRAPEYVKAKLSIKREDLIGFLQQQTGDWINVDIKVSQGGKWYAQIDDWKPDGGQRQDKTQRKPEREASYGDAPEPGFEDEVPFRQFRHHSYF